MKHVIPKILLCALWMTGWWIPAPALAQSTLISIETSMPAGDYASFVQPPDPAGFAGDSKEARELIEKRFGAALPVTRTLERYALAQSTGTGLLIPLPLGWRGYDDGKAARLINPVKRIAVTITVAPFEQFSTWNEAREYVWKLARQQADKRAQSDPRYQARLIRLASGVFGVRETNIQDSDGAFSAAVLYVPHPGDAKRVVRINLYCPVEEFERHLGLVSLILRDMQAGPFAPAAPASPPAKK